MEVQEHFPPELHNIVKADCGEYCLDDLCNHLEYTKNIYFHYSNMLKSVLVIDQLVHHSQNTLYRELKQYPTIQYYVERGMVHPDSTIEETFMCSHHLASSYYGILKLCVLMCQEHKEKVNIPFYRKNINIIINQINEYLSGL